MAWLGDWMSGGHCGTAIDYLARLRRDKGYLSRSLSHHRPGRQGGGGHSWIGASGAGGRHCRDGSPPYVDALALGSDLLSAMKTCERDWGCRRNSHASCHWRHCFRWGGSVLYCALANRGIRAVV